MTDSLVIVFVKNIKLGTVKTRLAKTIGNAGAFEVYTELVKITEEATSKISFDKRIYFSKSIVENQWKNEFKAVQNGKDLGERMLNAFKDGFKAGYKNIVLIGSDLPDINETHISNAIVALNENNIVFGPAEDGGYYLIGLNTLVPEIFQNKPWSQPHLLHETLQELHAHDLKVSILDTLNDIDTYEDLIASKFFKSNIKLQEKIQQLDD
jgi:uncharacterized protein